MTKIYTVEHPENGPIYYGKKREAMADAQRFANDEGTEVLVRTSDVAKLPRTELILALLHGRGWESWSTEVEVHPRNTQNLRDEYTQRVAAQRRVVVNA